MDQEVTQNYRGLKILVITLGLLILLMLGLIIAGAVMRVTGQGEGTPADEAVPEALSVPAGSRLIAVTPTEREVYLHVRDAEGTDHLYTLDRQSGALLWHRRLQPSQ